MFERHGELGFVLAGIAAAIGVTRVGLILWRRRTHR